jgi:drug/metabolite transporter (DMT)-like permease
VIGAGAARRRLAAAGGAGASPGVARAQCVAAAVLFSTGGAAIKGTSFSGLQVACLRSGVAAAAIAVMLPRARHGWSRRTLAVGVAYAGTLICFVVANKLTTAANTIFLQSTAPLYILLLSPPLLGERARRSDLAVMGFLALGLTLVFVGGQTASATAPHPLAGNVLALVSGVGWALTLMGLRWLGRGERGADAAAAGTVAGNVIAFLACLPAGVSASGDAKDWLLVVYLGVVQIGVAYVFLTAGVRHVPALEASLLLLVEPALNPVWVWIFQGESPGLLPVLGGALIIGTTAAKAVLDRRSLARAPPELHP